MSARRAMDAETRAVRDDHGAIRLWLRMLATNRLVETRTRRLLRRRANEAVPDRPDRRATPPITHQQLADLVGTSRETVTRVLKELKDSGWLEQEGKRYIVRIDED